MIEIFIYLYLIQVYCLHEHFVSIILNERNRNLQIYLDTPFTVLQIYIYVYTSFTVFVDASDSCNQLNFQLGPNGIGTTVVTRSWNLKVLKMKEKTKKITIIAYFC